jgi:hypothetical protein
VPERAAEDESGANQCRRHLARGAGLALTS